MTTGRLARVVGDVRDRTHRILTKCGALVEDVVQNLAEEGQGQAAPGAPEEDPGEDPEEETAAPTESVGSASS